MSKPRGRPRKQESQTEPGGAGEGKRGSAKGHPKATAKAKTAGSIEEMYEADWTNLRTSMGSGTKLSGTAAGKNRSGANLSGTKLRTEGETNLSGTTLSGTKLSGTKRRTNVESGTAAGKAELLRQRSRRKKDPG